VLGEPFTAQDDTHSVQPTGTTSRLQTHLITALPFCRAWAGVYCRGTDGSHVKSCLQSTSYNFLSNLKG